MTDTIDRQNLLARLRPIAEAAGAAIMEVYATDFDVDDKSDGSPVTAADHAADAVIYKGLREIAPDIHIVTEERFKAGDAVPEDAPFFLVDPLDGTKEFIRRNGEFTVNIALVEDGRPTAGIVLAPALGRAFWGAAGVGAFASDNGAVREIAARTPPAAGWTAIGSRSHTSREDARLLEGLTVAETKQAGSSLKFCLIAAGEADIYPRMGPTMEWDTAAGQAVLEAAGGHVVTPEGAPFTYRKPGLRNGYFLAFGRVRPPSVA